MKIQPAPKKLVFKMEIPKVGNLDVSSRPSARPWGEIIAVGGDVSCQKNGYKKGDKIFVAAWGPEEIEFEGEKYYFIDYDHPAVCGVISK